MLALAGRIEDALARGERADPGQDLSADAGDPGPAARGAYCTAAGELARRGFYGTVLDAPGYLLAGYLAADRAGEAAAAARAAYRLGLALSAGLADGAGPAGGRDAAIEAVAPAEAETGEAARACLGLDALRTGREAFSLPASRALACAARQAAMSGDRRLSLLASLRLARLWLARGQGAGAAGEALRARAAVLAADELERTDETDDLDLRVRLAEAALDAEPADAARVAAGVARLANAPAADLGEQAAIAALQGRLDLAAGRPAAAARFRQAMFLEGQRAAPLRLADWSMLLAKAEPEAAAEHVRAAYLALEAVRPLLPLRDPVTEESTFDLHMRQVFEAATQDALAGLGGEGDAGRIAQAQGIVEAYRQAELQNAFGNPCLAEPASFRPGRLGPDEAVLYPILLPDRVELLFSRGGEGHFERLAPGAAGRAEVAVLVRTMREGVMRGGGGWRAASRRLYDLLIAPVQSGLSPDGTLIIVPDIVLAGLPFAALQRADGRFLIQQTRLDIAPGLAYVQPGETRAGARAFVLAGSLDRDVALPFGAFDRLANAATEARYAAGLNDGEKGRRGLYLADFTRASLSEGLRENRVDVLHLATHASFNGGSDRSFVVANGGFISLEDLRGLLAANRALGKELDLLVLSACETAVGDDRASLGLAGAAVQAGAHGAIASLWPISDEGAWRLMRAFYDEYRGGAAKAQAMRDAQLALLAEPRFAHPFFWASLILVGGWR